MRLYEPPAASDSPTYRGDDNALIFVDQSVINILKRQKERRDSGRQRLGAAWVDHDLVFAP
ncbi:hypothetical protein ACIOWG_07985 [Streptomyces sp. NPDC087658]|uniref:hypothetical protein n=1 Tax=Streptomyces sp. NPDC087658 TaxID=3365800 RepID=UPI0038179055